MKLGSNFGPIGVCLVFHDINLVRKFIKRIVELQIAIQHNFLVTAYVTPSSLIGLNWLDGQLKCSGIEVLSCLIGDDRYFDFSMYRNGAQELLKCKCSGVIFANDTFVGKHNSTYLVNSFAKLVCCVLDDTLPMPIMVGPYSRSEFSFKNRRHDEFISTYIFYLNSTGLKNLPLWIDGEDFIVESLKERRLSTNVDAGIIRHCWLYHSIIIKRYKHLEFSEDWATRKLVTVYWERIISSNIRDNGVIWYLGSGLIGQVLIRIQSYVSILLSVLYNRFRNFFNFHGS